MIAADFANYARVPTPEDIAALKALGVMRVIIGTSFGTVFPKQIEVCEAAGFEVQEYQFVGHQHDTPRFKWLDVELDETEASVRAAVFHTHPDGIYTRRGIWLDNMNNWDIVSEFPWLRLWDANYGPLPRPFRPYGGWTDADMIQYHDTMDIGSGFEVDLSYYEEEGMTPEEKAEFEKMQQQIKDLQGYAWRDALRINDLERHIHHYAKDPDVADTSPPVQPAILQALGAK